MPEKFLLASCLQFAKTKTINQKKKHWNLDLKKKQKVQKVLG